MFSQKKRNYTWIYVLAITLLVIIGLLLIISTISNKNTKEYTEQKEIQEYQEENKDESSLPVEKPVPNKEKPEEKNISSYYLVKYDNNSIKIFFSDKSGSLVELEETEIIYETLSEEDQRRFNDGIKVVTREELNQVLMDYEG